MNIIYFGKGLRGYYCLKKILESNYNITSIIIQGQESLTEHSILKLAHTYNIEIKNPTDPNSRDFESYLKSKNADIFVLGGYGKILKQNIINIPKIICINLHGGKLPEYRGSSPMNWALINGESSFTLSIIKVATGVDTGDVILKKSFDIDINDTIVNLHNIANNEFPPMLVKTLNNITNNDYQLHKQTEENSAYYPLRFPEDGFILFDNYTAEQIHNRIRALTEPYPCAFTFFNHKKIKLISSKLTTTPYFGEPGRVYRKTKNGLLMCAKDKCLWIKKAITYNDNLNLSDIINRYDKLLTVQDYILNKQLQYNE